MHLKVRLSPNDSLTQVHGLFQKKLTEGTCLDFVIEGRGSICCNCTISPCYVIYYSQILWDVLFPVVLNGTWHCNALIRIRLWDTLWEACLRRVSFNFVFIFLISFLYLLSIYFSYPEFLLPSFFISVWSLLLLPVDFNFLLSDHT